LHLRVWTSLNTINGDKWTSKQGIHRFCSSIDYVNKRHEPSYQRWPCLSTLYELPSGPPLMVSTHWYCSSRGIRPYTATPHRYSKRSLFTMLVTARTIETLSLLSPSLFSFLLYVNLWSVSCAVFFLSFSLSLFKPFSLWFWSN